MGRNYDKLAYFENKLIQVAFFSGAYKLAYFKNKLVYQTQLTGHISLFF